MTDSMECKINYSPIILSLDLYYLKTHEGAILYHTDGGIGIITSNQLEKFYSPPSLFEYIILSVLTSSIFFVSEEYGGTLVGIKVQRGVSLTIPLISLKEKYSFQPYYCVLPAKGRP